MFRHRFGTKYTLWIAAVLVLVASPLATTSPNANAAAIDSCTAVRDGDTVSLTWVDDGGRHVIRRNDDWLATPGTNTSTFVDVDAPAGAEYVVRTRNGDSTTDRTCAPQRSDRCTFARAGTMATIEWIDDGGRHVLRRSGSWLSSPGVGASNYVDQPSPAGSTYQLLTRVGADLTTTECVEREGEPQPNAVAERVIHVSIDGLRVDAITLELMPNLSRLINEGASTMNARTDPGVTRTLPNHTSQLTGLAVKVHGIDYNEDRGRTVHDEAGRYVPSVFDVVHDHGGRTAGLVTKSKFQVHNRSWDETNGAIDTVGADNGRDKIDRFERAVPENVAQILIDELVLSDDLEFAFLHNRYPDRAGHDFGWGTPEYNDAVRLSDEILGQVIAAIEADPDLRSTTAVIVVSDHGGPLDDDNHSDPSRLDNYRIPFVVWGPTVSPGADLYELNEGHRQDPGDERVWLVGVQPIRGHEVANLALELLGYPPVPGSVFNAAQDLEIN